MERAAVRIIGAGLAGSEAAWQCAQRGVEVELFEMRPVQSTPAHQTADLDGKSCSKDYRGGARWVGSSVAMRTAGRRSRTVRDAAGAVHARASNGGFRWKELQ